MEKVETISSKYLPNWIVSFLIWFLAPLGADRLVDCISTGKYDTLVGALVVAGLATYFIPLKLRKTSE